MTTKHDPNDFERLFGGLLDEVLQLLRRDGVPHMLIGGLAVAIHAEPRATKDIDLSVSVAPDQATQWVAEMERPLANRPQDGVIGIAPITQRINTAPSSARAGAPQRGYRQMVRP